MSVPDHSIDPKILSSAKEEFLTKGYTDVSLRSVCRKAGVTTGALYKRFPGKESLFAAVVTPTLEAIKNMTEKSGNLDYTEPVQHDMQIVWDMSEVRLKGFVEFFYLHYDGLKLLLCCSEGSVYTNFLNEFVADYARHSMEYINAAYEKGITGRQIDGDELHLLLTAFWTAMFEVIIHDFPKIKALQYCKVIAKFFDWHAVLGF